jgi:hypothetical protein
LTLPSRWAETTLRKVPTSTLRLRFTIAVLRTAANCAALARARACVCTPFHSDD